MIVVSMSAHVFGKLLQGLRSTSLPGTQILCQSPKCWIFVGLGQGHQEQLTERFLRYKFQAYRFSCSVGAFGDQAQRGTIAESRTTDESVSMNYKLSPSLGLCR